MVIKKLTYYLTHNYQKGSALFTNFRLPNSSNNACKAIVKVAVSYVVPDIHFSLLLCNTSVLFLEIWQGKIRKLCSTYSGRELRRKGWKICFPNCPWLWFPLQRVKHLQVSNPTLTTRESWANGKSTAFLTQKTKDTEQNHKQNSERHAYPRSPTLGLLTCRRIQRTETLAETCTCEFWWTGGHHVWTTLKVSFPGYSVLKRPHVFVASTTRKTHRILTVEILKRVTCGPGRRTCRMVVKYSQSLLRCKCLISRTICFLQSLLVLALGKRFFSYSSLLWHYCLVQGGKRKKRKRKQNRGWGNNDQRLHGVRKGSRARRMNVKGAALRCSP